MNNNLAIKQPILPIFGFAHAATPLKDNTPLWGGWIRILSSQPASSALTVSHGLKYVPYGLLLMQSTTVQEMPLTWKAWDNKNIYIQLSNNLGAGDKMVILIT